MQVIVQLRLIFILHLFVKIKGQNETGEISLHLNSHHFLFFFIEPELLGLDILTVLLGVSGKLFDFLLRNRFPCETMGVLVCHEIPLPKLVPRSCEERRHLLATFQRRLPHLARLLSPNSPSRLGSFFRFLIIQFEILKLESPGCQLGRCWQGLSKLTWYPECRSRKDYARQ